MKTWVTPKKSIVLLQKLHLTQKKFRNKTISRISGASTLWREGVRKIESRHRPPRQQSHLGGLGHGSPRLHPAKLLRNRSRARWQALDRIAWLEADICGTTFTLLCVRDRLVQKAVCLARHSFLPLRRRHYGTQFSSSGASANVGHFLGCLDSTDVQSGSPAQTVILLHSIGSASLRHQAFFREHVSI